MPPLRPDFSRSDADRRGLDQYYKEQFWSRSQGSDEPTAKTIAKDRRYSQGRWRCCRRSSSPLCAFSTSALAAASFCSRHGGRGYQVEGIEPSAGYARYCRQAYGLDVHAATLADTELGDKRYDLITCNHSLEHMRDPLGALARLHDHLDPDGYLYVSVPDLGDPDTWPCAIFTPATCAASPTRLW